MSLSLPILSNSPGFRIMLDQLVVLLSTIFFLVSVVIKLKTIFTHKYMSDRVKKVKKKVYNIIAREKKCINYLSQFPLEQNKILNGVKKILNAEKIIK